MGVCSSFEAFAAKRLRDSKAASSRSSIPSKVVDKSTISSGLVGDTFHDKQVWSILAGEWQQ